MICEVQPMGHSGTCPGQIRKCPKRKGSGDLGTFGTCVFRTCPIVPSRHDELLSCRIDGSGCEVAPVVNQSLPVVRSHLAAASQTLAVVRSCLASAIGSSLGRMPIGGDSEPRRISFHKSSDSKGVRL